MVRGDDLRAEYERIQLQRNVPVILDLGANIGASSLYFHLIWPNAQIVAVEPAKDNFELLQENTKAYRNILPLQAAVASTDGLASIIDDDAEKWAYRTEIRSGAAGICIDAFSVSTLLAKINNVAPFICKIDIEGAEAELFSAGCDWVDSFPLLIVE